MVNMMKIEKKDITTSRLGENFLITAKDDFRLIFTQDAINELFKDVNEIMLKELPIGKCKNCGEDIRGLRGAKEIPIHILTEKRNCKDGVTMAEWSQNYI